MFNGNLKLNYKTENYLLRPTYSTFAAPWFAPLTFTHNMCGSSLLVPKGIGSSLSEAVVLGPRTTGYNVSYY